MNGCKTIGARALKESVGIVAHIALGDKYLGAFGTFEQYWQIGYLVVGLILCSADVGVGLLVRGVEVASLRDVSLEGCGQMVVDTFVYDIYNTFLIYNKAIGHTVVVGSELYAVALEVER